MLEGEIEDWSKMASTCWNLEAAPRRAVRAPIPLRPLSKVARGTSPFSDVLLPEQARLAN